MRGRKIRTKKNNNTTLYYVGTGIDFAFRLHPSRGSKYNFFSHNSSIYFSPVLFCAVILKNFFHSSFFFFYNLNSSAQLTISVKWKILCNRTLHADRCTIIKSNLHTYERCEGLEIRLGGVRISKKWNFFIAESCTRVDPNFKRAVFSTFYSGTWILFFLKPSKQNIIFRLLQLLSWVILCTRISMLLFFSTCTYTRYARLRVPTFIRKSIYFPAKLV